MTRRWYIACTIGIGIGSAAMARASDVVVDVLIDVPSVIAVDVRGDLTFDLSRLPGPKAPNDCENVYPPGSACQSVTYDPTGQRDITVAVFDNSEGQRSSLNEKVSGQWSKSYGVGVPTTAFRSEDRAKPSAARPLAVAPAEVDRPVSRGQWVTYVRTIRLVTTPESLTETPKGGVQTTVTYEVTRAD
jgi:hypothetical protein